MKRYYHKKLVRDKIPEIIESKGDKYKTRILSKNEFRQRLREKLVEESKEVVNSTKKELTNELSDVVQLARSIAKLEGISFRKIEKNRKEKLQRAGAFTKKIFLIWSDKPAGKK